MCQLFGFSTFLLATSEKAGKSRQVNLELADGCSFLFLWHHWATYSHIIKQTTSILFNTWTMGNCFWCARGSPGMFDWVVKTEIWIFHFASFLVTLQKNSQLQKLNLLWMFSQFSKPYIIIARDDEENNLASVVQVACHATVLLLIGICPFLEPVIFI